MNIGVLAVQGAFIEHIKVLEHLGCHCIELRKKEDLQNNFQGLVLPGGESTVQGKLLKELDMFEPLQTMIKQGLPTLATCAGLILLAEKLSNDPNTYFGTLPVTVKRNAYGRQLGSFKCTQEFKDLGKCPMTFIRAPVIQEVQENVKILASVENQIVAVQYKNQIGLTFHPELDSDTRIHELFVKNIYQNII